MTIETTENQVQITEYSVAAFVFKIEEYIKKGYSVSQDILGYPVQSGVAYYCVMVKGDAGTHEDNQGQGQVKKTRKTKEF